MVGLRWNPLRFSWRRAATELPQVSAQHSSKAAPACACPAAHCFPLAHANEGDCVRSTLLQGGEGMAVRLASMGLNLGYVIRVAHRVMVTPSAATKRAPRANRDPRRPEVR